MSKADLLNRPAPTRTFVNPFAVAGSADPLSPGAPPVPPAQCSYSHVLERAEKSTPKAQALAAAIRADLERLTGIVDRADEKGRALREIGGLQQRLAELNNTLADLDAAEADDEAACAPQEPADASAEMLAELQEAMLAEDHTGAHDAPAQAGHADTDAPQPPAAEDDGPQDPGEQDASTQMADRMADHARTKQLAHSTAVRAWAADNGHKVSKAGRLSNRIINAYLAEHPHGQAPDA